MSANIHEKAAKGFAQEADAYERGRPEYPETAINFLAENMPIEDGTVVLDLGAGTGKLTRALLPLGAKVIAVEPVKEMRDKLASLGSGVEVLDGVAEKIPLKDRSVDVVLVAQAFHWFKGQAALKEIYRVLKEDGILALVYNVRDERVGWVEEMTRVIDGHRGQTPQYRTMEWKRVFDENEMFSRLSVEKFTYSQVGNIETVLDRTRSISFIASLPPAEQKEVLAQVKNIVETNPATKGQAEIRIPYITHIYWCEKI